MVALLASNVRFEADLESETHGLRYLGPTLRGAFGHALKDEVCVAPHGQCHRCHLRDVCPYPSVFEGRPSQDRELMRLYPAVPQPFVLDVPGPDDRAPAGTDLRWGLRVFGPALEHWPYLVDTVRIVGERGLGSQRTRYRVRRILDGEDGTTLWSGGRPAMRPPRPRPIGGGNGRITTTMRITFETPLHIRTKGRLLDRADGLEIVLAAQRRLRLLHAFYGEPGEASGQTARRLESHEFETIEQSLRLWSISRFSGRQRRRVPLAGILGTAKIRGPWPELADLLRAARDVHIGKHTTFGFGRISWEAV